MTQKLIISVVSLNHTVVSLNYIVISSIHDDN